MKEYHDIVHNVLDQGKWKVNRTGVKTLTLANQHFSYDFVDDKFPLLTTKRMPLKTIAVELEGFINGITDKKWYQDRGCKIWNEWANPTAVKADLMSVQNMSIETVSADDPANIKLAQKQVEDLGPIYGYQWRNFDAHYRQSHESSLNQNYHHNPNGVKEGYDQLKSIVDTLKKNPNDRRMVCSAWNPNQIHMMALPPCHFCFVITHIDGVLNLHWTQRSADLILGIPFNIASYALLLLLLCKTSNMQPGNLSGMLCDCHIYENHIEGAKEQMRREAYRLPKLHIESNNIFDWTHKDLTLMNYHCHPKIQFDVAV